MPLVYSWAFGGSSSKTAQLWGMGHSFDPCCKYLSGW